LQKRSMLRRATIASSEIVEPEIGRMVVMSASPEFFCVHSFRAGVCGPSNERTNTLSRYKRAHSVAYGAKFLATIDSLVLYLFSWSECAPVGTCSASPLHSRLEAHESLCADFVKN
jgi:hypothetical protein